MKEMKLVLISGLPFLTGYALNFLIFAVPFNIPLNLLGFIFLIAWFFFGKYAHSIERNRAKAFVLSHSVPFITLLLVLFQQEILKQYWGNIFGFLTQLYFIPALNVAGYVTRFIRVFNFSLSYVITFLLMCLVFNLGYPKDRRYS